MTKRLCRSACSGLAALAALAFTMTGCGQTGTPPATGTGAPGTTTAAASADGESGHNYKGRDWCAEHGVPESICAQCDASLVARFKEDGDWCEEHDRPDSQCFICHPDLKEKFAAEYRAKYGEDPPPMAEEEGEDAHDDEGHDHEQQES